MRSLMLVVGCVCLCALAGGDSARSDDAKDTFFNGKDLNSYEGLIKEYWTVKDGAIVGASPEGLKFNTFLCSKKKYKDFELRFQVRLKDGTGNSGVQIRSKIRESPKDKANFAVEGPQCDMGGVYWGSLYGEHFGGMMKAAPKEVVEKNLKKGEFNSYSIKCVGKHVTIKLNDEITVDDDFPKLPEDGIIAWQLHSGPPMEVTFRAIEFKDLSAK